MGKRKFKKGERVVQHPPPESAVVHTQESLGREAPRFKPIYAKLDALAQALRILSRATQRNGEPLAYDREAFAEALDARKEMP